MKIYRHSYNFATHELITKECEAIQDYGALKIRIPNESGCSIIKSHLNSNLFGIPQKSWAAMDRGECGEAYMFCESSDPAGFIQAIMEYCQNSISVANKALSKAQREYDKTRENMDSHIQNLGKLLTNKSACISWKRDLTQMIKNLGYGQYICTSFEEAEQNDRRKNIVIIDNADIYLTYKYKNKFGEFVCWVEDEFEEDPSVYDSVRNWVVDIFSQSEKQIDNALKASIFPFDFIPYEKEEWER